MFNPNTDIKITLENSVIVMSYPAGVVQRIFEEEGKWVLTVSPPVAGFTYPMPLVLNAESESPLNFLNAKLHDAGTFSHEAQLATKE